jgi:hypothetical protein
MALSLKHTTQAVGVDNGNGEIHKNEWNEEHTLQIGTGKLVGRTTAATGNAEEISVGSSLTLSALTLSVNTSNLEVLLLAGGTVIGNSTFSANLSITGDRLTTTKLFAGNTDITGTLGVSNAATFSNTSAHTGAATFSNTVTITGQTNVGATFNALGLSTHTGAATFSNTVTITGQTNVAATFNAQGLSTHNGAATFANTVTITGQTNVAGTFNALGLSTHNGAATFANTVTITGVTNATGTFNALGLSTHNGAATFANTVTITGTANVAGVFNALANSTHNGAATFANTLTVTGSLTTLTSLNAGNTSITGTLAAGNTTITGSIGTTTLTSGNTTINGTLGAGNTTITGSLGATTASIGNTTLTGTLGVTGAATFSNTVGVTGALSFANTVRATGFAGGKALTTNATSFIIESTVSETELSYLGGATSNVQAQLNSKASSTHTHPQSDITNLTTDLGNKYDKTGGAISGNVTINATTFTQNIAVGNTTIDPWGAGYSAVQMRMAGRGLYAANTAGGDMGLVYNQYFDGTNWKYIANGNAYKLWLNQNGGFGFEVAESGTAAANVLNSTTKFGVSEFGSVDIASDDGFDPLTVYSNNSLRMKLTTAGALSVNGTITAGNTTITGFANVSGAVTFNSTTLAKGTMTFQDAGTSGYLEFKSGDASGPGYVDFRTAEGTRRGYIGYVDGTALNILATGGWTWKITGNTAHVDAASFANNVTVTGQVNSVAGFFKNGIDIDIGNKIQALGSISGATSVNTALGQVVTATCTGAVTWSFTSLQTGRTNNVTLHLTNPGAGTQTFPSGTTWDRNASPTLPAAGKTSLMFETYDDGTTWIASQIWRDVA